MLLAAINVSGDSPEGIPDALVNMPDFSATFEQITSDSKGRVLQTVTGQLWVSKPYRFRWHAEPPMEQVMVADGELLWLFDPDLEQVTVQKMRPAISTLPVLILTGNVTRLSRDFVMDHYQDESGDHYSFRPKAAAESFKIVSVAISNDQIQRISIIDTLDQRTRIELDNIQTEESFPDGTFHFQIPDGTDVIRDY
jgi:outer membrane lipoprotein carrier protein